MKTATPHDSRYKGMFKCLTMLLSLLRSGAGSFQLPANWLERIDLGSMRVEPTESDTDADGERRSDLVISFRLRAPKGRRGPRLFFHIEFQSKSDPHMHWRFDEYIHGVRSQVAIERRDSRSLVISILVYTGRRKWKGRTHTVSPSCPFSVEEVERVAGTVVRHGMVDIHHCAIEDLSEDEILTWLIRLERAKTKEDIHEALDGASRLLKSEGRDGRRLMGLLVERARDLLGESAEELNVPGLLRDWAKGDEDMGTMVQSIGDRWLARHDAKLYKQERTEQRKLLRAQVKLRFGTDTAKQFSALMKRTNDSDWLNQIGRWIVASKSSEEFLARVENRGLPNSAPTLEAAD